MITRVIKINIVFITRLTWNWKNTQCVTLVVKIDKINVVYTLNALCAFDTSLCMKLINQLVVSTQDYKKNLFKGKLWRQTFYTHVYMQSNEQTEMTFHSSKWTFTFIAGMWSGLPEQWFMSQTHITLLYVKN